MDDIVIIVNEHDDRHGRISSRLLDGTVVVASSRRPFLDGARVLLQQGHHPDQRLVMRHRGSSIDAMRGTIGEAAKWTVMET
jgi:hypothetical protein